MHIAEAAAESGLSIDTIRFYERSGMLPALDRDARGWRRVSPDALEWLKNLSHLRRTGMPLKDVRRFAQLVHGAEADLHSSARERLALLRAHAARLDARRAELDACAAYLDHKIAVYSRITE